MIRISYLIRLSTKNNKQKGVPQPHSIIARLLRAVVFLPSAS